MELDIKLTGILNIYSLAEGESCAAFGTEVAPRVQAHHHQRSSSPPFTFSPLEALLMASMCPRHLLPSPRPYD